MAVATALELGKVAFETVEVEVAAAGAVAKTVTIAREVKLGLLRAGQKNESLEKRNQ